MSSCCAPRGPGGGSAPPVVMAPVVVAPVVVAGARHEVEQAAIPAQTFAMGDAHGDGDPRDGETPVHPVTLKAFSIDATPVTVADFTAFVDATGYRTEAETFGYSAVFHADVTDLSSVVGQPPATPWWYGVAGADWAHPSGPSSTVADRQDHPVTHVSWNDANAYAAWAGRRLPTEAEWEAAARGGVEAARYPWGDEVRACNIFQGEFPRREGGGWPTTAPVRSYTPNDYGLWQPIGNVWEWCADWFSPGYYAVSPGVDPRGPESGETKVMRGGSFLCHDSYCNRYRNAARSSNTLDSSTSNLGFRTVAE